jgi:hypothetical protein
MVSFGSTSFTGDRTDHIELPGSFTMIYDGRAKLSVLKCYFLTSRLYKSKQFKKLFFRSKTGYYGTKDLSFFVPLLLFHPLWFRNTLTFFACIMIPAQAHLILTP